MTWKFDPATVKAVDLKDAKAGDILCPLRSGAANELWLKLAGQPSSMSLLNLTGSSALEVWNLQPAGAVPTLLIAEGPQLHLEVASPEGVAGTADEQLGHLLIADSGAYMVAKIRQQGFSNDCYISLATWSVAAAHVQARASFSTWRLIDTRDPADKRVVLSLGDWSTVRP